ncbi:MAG: hypothetical protein PWP28_396 [Oceanotoga sp.]|uniref:Dna2/Cas4 domain-containing protein n=1 Tax=Oceanotoga sp. TaxID=2108366 RepID=UPI0026506DA4|nr:hypothetical protein [Oceanotoga sp.]
MFLDCKRQWLHANRINLENENELLNIMKNMNELIKGDIPEVKLIKGCKNCAFYEYCFL